MTFLTPPKSVHIQLPLAKNHILALFRCKTDYGDLSSPFPVRWCATIRLRSQDTPTITIRCGVYSRAAFISLERGIHAAFIGGQHLFEEIQYIQCVYMLKY